MATTEITSDGTTQIMNVNEMDPSEQAVVVEDEVVVVVNPPAGGKLSTVTKKATRQCVRIKDLRAIGFKSLKEWCKDDLMNIYAGRMALQVDKDYNCFLGNPYLVKQNVHSPKKVVRMYTTLLLRKSKEERDTIREKTSGKVVGCWCQDGEPCHVDPILCISNSKNDTEAVQKLQIMLQ